MHKTTHTGWCTLRCTCAPDVMCVSVHVDRDQRWVLKHFGACSPHSHSTDCETCHYLSLGACRSRCYTAHRLLPGYSLLSVRLKSSHNRCTRRLRDSWKFCMEVINQNHHISTKTYLLRGVISSSLVLGSAGVSNFLRLALGPTHPTPPGGSSAHICL